MPRSKPISVRLSERGKDQLLQLTDFWNVNITTAVEISIEDVYMQAKRYHPDYVTPAGRLSNYKQQELLHEAIQQQQAPQRPQLQPPKPQDPPV